ncbi:hypothetical protein GLOTRDRAFT_74874 [Gloeophyllum trabeum ATCC 11539]|uniref:CDP-alcohol phosphatidyltransferase n=1 Tax=Gloeophyllum trabeum (strain ATCC 11539 / FP-39264 / Madison 617) TaxID=670483 RepID=S7QA83_GLOTA|nr:uncharacterized protein GLOTRDRAFT_74874 [Gloeophyllum trabeum ATCC 11539]EPQ56283.1 hypothetical protein GLOTRDRAFT_74874 [Gloeophyllum trabeum ATCC 11539]
MSLHFPTSLSFARSLRVRTPVYGCRRLGLFRGKSTVKQHFRPFSVYTALRSDRDNKPNSTRLEERRSKPIRENVYTWPNLLTMSRIAACPVLGYAIVKGDFYIATSLLVYAGLTDFVDGFLARRYNMRSVLGTILDPAADKTLMTTLTITLAVKGMLPVPLAVIILGRDVALSLSAFYIRYTSLPAPKTWARYWDFSLPSAEVRPTEISKVNTALQLVLMGTTTISPLLPTDISLPLQGLQWIVAATTIWSGLSYVFSKDAVRIIAQHRVRRKGPSDGGPQK